MSKVYTAEFKEQAVALYRKSSTTYAAVARELGCDAGSLAKWVRMADNPDKDAELSPFQMQEQIRNLKRENARLAEENAILLKASAFFATKVK